LHFKAVLLDLDNTLILFDEITFFQSYLPKISEAFSDLMPAALFQEKLLSATKALLMNNGTMNNADFFMKCFCAGLDVSREVLWERFIQFYDNGFDSLESLVMKIDGGRDVILAIKKKHIKLVIASNPMWTEKVQYKRLLWAGLGDIRFDLITHIENMSFCKPQLGYYQEICQKIDVEPQECLMAGNDPVNDMVVAQLGMKTYLTTDAQDKGFTSFSMSRELRKHNTENIPEPDFSGSLTDLIHVIE
jgi:FMN phosphatase YigB (HAD superfamily)